MNLPVGQILLQVFHYLPTVDERLELRRSAEVFKEIAALFDALETIDRGEKSAFCVGLLAPGFVAVGLHVRTNVLTR